MSLRCAMGSATARPRSRASRVFCLYRQLCLRRVRLGQHGLLAVPRAPPGHALAYLPRVCAGGAGLIATMYTDRHQPDVVELWLETEPDADGCVHIIRRLVSKLSIRLAAPEVNPETYEKNCMIDELSRKVRIGFVYWVEMERCNACRKRGIDPRSGKFVCADCASKAREKWRS